MKTERHPLVQCCQFDIIQIKTDQHLFSQWRRLWLKLKLPFCYILTVGRIKIVQHLRWPLPPLHLASGNKNRRVRLHLARFSRLSVSVSVYCTSYVRICIPNTVFVCVRERVFARVCRIHAAVFARRRSSLGGWPTSTVCSSITDSAIPSSHTDRTPICERASTRPHIGHDTWTGPDRRIVNKARSLQPLTLEQSRPTADITHCCVRVCVCVYARTCGRR